MSLESQLVFPSAPQTGKLSKNLSHVPCKFFRQGACQAGNSCPFSHSLDVSTVLSPCKYFQKGNCKFGLKCALAHVLPDGRRINTKALNQLYSSHNNQNGNSSAVNAAAAQAIAAQTAAIQAATSHAASFNYGNNNQSSGNNIPHSNNNGHNIISPSQAYNRGHVRSSSFGFNSTGASRPAVATNIMNCNGNSCGDVANNGLIASNSLSSNNSLSNPNNKVLATQTSPSGQYNLLYQYQQLHQPLHSISSSFSYSVPINKRRQSSFNQHNQFSWNDLSIDNFVTSISPNTTVTTSATTNTAVNLNHAGSESAIFDEEDEDASLYAKRDFDTSKLFTRDNLVINTSQNEATAKNSHEHDAMNGAEEFGNDNDNGADDDLKFEEDFVPASLMDLLSSQELKRKIAKTSKDDDNKKDVYGESEKMVTTDEQIYTSSRKTSFSNENSNTVPTSSRPGDVIEDGNKGTSSGSKTNFLNLGIGSSSRNSSFVLADDSGPLTFSSSNVNNFSDGKGITASSSTIVDSSPASSASNTWFGGSNGPLRNHRQSFGSIGNSNNSDKTFGGSRHSFLAGSLGTSNANAVYLGSQNLQEQSNVTGSNAVTGNPIGSHSRQRNSFGSSNSSSFSTNNGASLTQGFSTFQNVHAESQFSGKPLGSKFGNNFNGNISHSRSNSGSFANQQRGSISNLIATQGDSSKESRFGIVSSNGNSPIAITLGGADVSNNIFGAGFRNNVDARTIAISAPNSEEQGLVNRMNMMDFS